MLKENIVKEPIFLRATAFTRSSSKSIVIAYHARILAYISWYQVSLDFLMYFIC